MIDEGGVEPRNADAKANAEGQFIIPIRNEGFLTAENVIVYLQADELGTTVYDQQEVTVTVPANGKAHATFDYSGLPPGDARLEVTLNVVDTPTHDESDESAIITIKFSNIADEDGESDWLVVVIVLLTDLFCTADTRQQEKALLVASDTPIDIQSPKVGRGLLD